MGYFDEERLLTESESIVMRGIWDVEGDISIPDLIELLNERYDRPYARTTVVTFLLKLSDKGFVRTYRKGKFAYIRKMVSREDYRKILTENLLKDWYGGDVEALFADVRDGK